MYACGSFWRTALEPLAHLPLTHKCREQKSQGFPSHSMKGWTLPFKITMKSDLSWLSFYPSFICILDKLHLLSCRILIICHFAAAAAKSLQSCPILCDPIDGSPPGSLIPGILQARTLGLLYFVSELCECLCHLVIYTHFIHPPIPSCGNRQSATWWT